MAETDKETIIDVPSPDSGKTNGTIITDIFAGVPKELRFSKDGNDRLAKFKDVKSFGKSYLEMETALADRVKIPNDNSSEEDWNAFYAKTRPKDIKDYQIKRPEKIPEGMVYDDNLEQEIKKAAFEIGINQKQLAVLAEKFNNYQIATFTESQKSIADGRKEGETALKDDWKDSYDVNIEIAKRACKELGSEEFNKFLIETGLGNEPIIVRTFYDIGKKMLDDVLVKNEGGGSGRLENSEYKPAYPDSPEMYANDDSEEGKRAREWFKKNKGYNY